MTSRVSISKERDEYLYSALGYTLHNLYNVTDSTWRKALLERMTLNIEGVRPALLDMSIGLRIEELLKFRHVFRNIYKSPLVLAKVEFANQAAHDVAEDFRVYHERFLGFLQILIVELEGASPT